VRRLIIISGLIVLVHGWCFAQDARPRYSIKQDDSDIGSNIKRNVVSGSVIPVDKKYNELTPEEQGYVKSQYEGMGPADEPPFPIDGLRPIYKAVAAAQQKLLVKGTLSMFVEVDSQGKPVSVSVYRSPDPKMTQVVGSILMLQSFKPALCNGQPCSMQFPFRITFNIRL
jgi:hypothetical protein